MAKKKSIFNVTEEFGGKFRKQHSFIAANYNFRYNQVTTQLEYQTIKSGKITSEYQPVDDRVRNLILKRMGNEDLDFSNVRFRSFVENDDISIPYNVIEEYFYNLPEWSGENDYIQELANTVKTDDDEFFVDVLKRYLVGAVDCLLNNKSNDICLILQGDQGIGKTKWMKTLIPKNLLDDFFHESPIDTKNKEHDEYLSTKWFIMLDELEAMRSNEINALKAFVTKTQISHRKVFKEYGLKFPRRASFLGNVNDSEFLSDTTGSRRWLAFAAKEIDYEHKIDINKVYAQAFYLLNSGTFRHWFNREEINVLNERNEQFSIKSKEEEMLVQNFEILEAGQHGGEWFSSTEIIERLVCFYPKTAVSLNNRKLGLVATKLIRMRGGEKKKSGTAKYYLRYIGPSEEIDAVNKAGKQTNLKVVGSDDDLPF